MLLRAKLAKGDADLDAFEARLCSDAAAAGLQRAHSSPSLPQEAKEKNRGAKTSKSLKAPPSSSSPETKSKRAEPQKQGSKQEEAA